MAHGEFRAGGLERGGVLGGCGLPLLLSGALLGAPIQCRDLNPPNSNQIHKRYPGANLILELV